jgi:hypothetical protein
VDITAADIFTELEKFLSKNVDTKDSWENNFKMSDKVVLARVKGSALGFCWNITDNKLNFALVVDIVTKKGKQKDLNKIKDNLVAKRLVIGMAGPVCQNQAGVPLPLYKIIGSDLDPSAVGVHEHHNVEMGNDADNETDSSIQLGERNCPGIPGAIVFAPWIKNEETEQGYKFVIRLSRLRSIPKSESFADSECTISSVGAENFVLAQIYANCAEEILENLEFGQKKGCGFDNISDVSRGEAKAKDYDRAISSP